MTHKESSKGLTLIELVIVLAILGILAVILIPNVARFQGEQTAAGPAQYTVYVEEEGSLKQVATIDLGEVRIVLPKVMSVGRSAQASLRLVPSQAVADNFSVSYGPTGIPDAFYVVSNVVDLYPVMGAELKAASFDVSGGVFYANYRAVSLDSATVWEWIISPNSAGQQAVAFELYAPVRVKGFEEMVAKAVYTRSFTMSVNQPFNWALVWGAAGGILSLLGIWTWLRRMLRRRGRPHGANDSAKSGLKQDMPASSKGL